MIDLALVASLSSSLVGVLGKVLQQRTRERLGDQASDIVAHDPASPQRVRELFQATKQRLSSAWRIGMVMTIALFVIFIGMVLTAIVLGVVFEKPMYSVIFGGLSAASLLTVVVWKPYEMTFGATITIQQLEMILITLEQEWLSCKEIQDPQTRSTRIAAANKAALSEMSKLRQKKV